MKDQPHRLASTTRHFAGAAITRSRPLKFKFNGQQFSAFEGDTVLSALVACGYDGAGLRGGWPMALSPRHAPPIYPGSHDANASKALPMERTPVTAGAHYLTFGTGGLSQVGAAIGRLRGTSSLGLDLDNPGTMHRPWLGNEPEANIDMDVVIVGGGVAGLTGAIAAAKGGKRVTLVEANWHLGGYARLFGSQEGQETPDQSIKRLVAAVAQDHTITVMLGTQAIAARPGVVRVHSVFLTRGEVVARTLDLCAPRIVLATGVIERLPIFSGNRLPGVWTSLDSYSLAEQFGVWPGKTALLATGGNIAYRLGTLATDAGVAVSRILDARVDPQSRFVEFAKAYGITMAVGTMAGEAKPGPKNRGISVIAQPAAKLAAQPGQPLTTDRLVLSGGWQPDLSLWHMAGGASHWSVTNARLEPDLESLKGVALAGSAAGYLSHHACVLSGKAAVAQVFNRRRINVEERLIDPIYETPDVPTPIAKQSFETAAPAFLDGGQSLIERPEPKPSRWPVWLPMLRRAPAWSLADAPQPLALGDIAAGTQLGAIPPDSAGIVAQERVALIAIASPLKHTAEPARTESKLTKLRYLAGRFGQNSLTCQIAPLEQRWLETGALIYGDADEADPFKAIGVVVRGGSEGVSAMLARQTDFGKTVYVREDNRSFPVRVAGEASGAALGSSAGPP